MNRRQILAALAVAGIGCGIAGPAAAEAPDSKRHKVCVAFPQGDPTVPSGDGICINWIGPIQPE